MSEQETAVVEREFVVGTPTVVDEFNRLWEKLSDPERRRMLEGTFEPVKPPHPTRGHIAIRPTFPRLDPMTGGPLPSREEDLRWLGGFQSATCMPSRSRYRRRGTEIGSPYVDFGFF